MASLKDKGLMKRHLSASSSTDQISSTKKPRRSQRLNPTSDGVQVDKEPSTDGALIAEAIDDPSAPHETEKSETKVPTPRSSPQPLTAETQIASQIHFTQPTNNNDEAEDVWGYLTPMNNTFDEVLRLTKRSCSGEKLGGSVGRRNSKKKTPIGATGYLIGRHQECDIVVDSLVVSNRHCVIFKETAGSEPLAIVEDLSSNGTHINGTLIGRNKRRTLKTGDEIAVAPGIVFVFRYPHHATSNSFRDSYTLGQRLGSGHFATVHIATEKSTGINYAVKIFKKPRQDDKSRLSGLQQEIAVLMSVSHPNVLCLKETYEESDGVYLVLELASGGELFEYIVEEGKISEEDTRRIFIQLFNGLKYLHERNIVHRDIKPENILLCDRNLTVKLADFGLAKIIGEDSFTTSLCGTPSYVAPEILQKGKYRKYSRAVDVWSLGVVLYICLCGFPPFSEELNSAENPYSLYDQILMGRFDFPAPYWDSVSDEALDLIGRMLTVDPDKRITIEKALDHPWTRAIKAGPGDSTDSLAGAFNGMGFVRKRVERERTLLSHAIKNQKAKRIEGDVRKSDDDGTTAKNDTPAATTVFMKIGGKGVDETLYKDVESQRSEKQEFSLF